MPRRPPRRVPRLSAGPRARRLPNPGTWPVCTGCLPLASAHSTARWQGDCRRPPRLGCGRPALRQSSLRRDRRRSCSRGSPHPRGAEPSPPGRLQADAGGHFDLKRCRKSEAARECPVSSRHGGPSIPLFASSIIAPAGTPRYGRRKSTSVRFSIVAEQLGTEATETSLGVKKPLALLPRTRIEESSVLSVPSCSKSN